MKISKRIVSILLLIALSGIGLSVNAQQQSSRNNTRQVGDILHRLTQSSQDFRSSLTDAIENRRDDNRPENDINSFERDFANATAQLNTRFTRGRAGIGDVRNVLQKASVVNGFMNRHRLNSQAQDDWASVRTNLNALANAYGVTSQLSSQAVPRGNSNRDSRLSENELDQLIGRIEGGEDTFRLSITDAYGKTRGGQMPRQIGMYDSMRLLHDATTQLRAQFNARQPLGTFIERVLARATPINTYMRNNRLTTSAQNSWSTLREDLNTLAGAHNLSASWQNGTDTLGNNFNSGLTGTFRLDATRSDNPRDIAERATRSLSNNERQGVSDRMLARLESPEMLAIQRSGSTITLASSRAQQSTFQADGVERREQVGNGLASRVTATLQGDRLTVRSTGFRDTDFNVTFESIDNGSGLRVRREILSDRMNQPVVVNSVYERTSDAAQWNIFNGAQPTLGNSSTSSGEFIVRDGETVVAVLNEDLTTKTARQGDRFTMTVRQPGEYQGAIIEGTVGTVETGGRLTGRAGISLNFDSIRLRNGQTYRFAGILGNVRTVNGDNVRVDNEGSAQGDNQTTQTVQRAGIGTAIGAIIGAIASGGKGAAIGGIIGAAGGAGSVYVQGKDNLELLSGTELTIRAGAPR
ncbi:MAG: hypothetical protein ABI596_00780 [Pyrinomonadaceae bacterium]